MKPVARFFAAVAVVLGCASFYAPQAFAAKNAVIEADEAKIYRGPGTNFPEVTTLKKDTFIVVANLPIAGFYKTRIPDGRIGFVSGDEIAIYPEGPDSTPVRPVMEPGPSPSPSASPSPSVSPAASPAAQASASPVPSPSRPAPRAAPAPHAELEPRDQQDDTIRLPNGASPADDDSDVLPAPPSGGTPLVTAPAPQVTYTPQPRGSEEQPEARVYRAQIRIFGGLLVADPTAIDQVIGATTMSSAYDAGLQLSLPMSDLFDFLFRFQGIFSNRAVGGFQVLVETLPLTIGPGLNLIHQSGLRLRLDALFGYAYSTGVTAEPLSGGAPNVFQTGAFAEMLAADLTLPLSRRVAITLEAGYLLLNTGSVAVQPGASGSPIVNSTQPEPINLSGPAFTGGFAFLF